MNFGRTIKISNAFASCEAPQRSLLWPVFITEIARPAGVAIDLLALDQTGEIA